MKKIGILLGIILVFIIIGIFWWQNGLLAKDPANKTPIIFVVNKGDGVKEISKNLKDKGLIRNQIVFFLYTRFNNIDKQIQAGDFRLNPSMNTSEIATNLTHGILDIWVTIPEGFRAEEIADILKDKIPSYNATWRQELIKNEGYLFPDTYLIPKDATIETILSTFKNNFENKYSTIKTSNTKYTKNQLVIIASMIEREAKNQEDRPLIASVILNRLSIGMKLDIDATVQYALAYSTEERKWWRKNLTLDDLAINSDYNTYKNAGLPPTAISNPGLNSLNAAANPASTDYLYYMTDGKGVTHFAKTNEEHNLNIKKYGL